MFTFTKLYLIKKNFINQSNFAIFANQPMTMIIFYTMKRHEAVLNPLGYFLSFLVISVKDNLVFLSNRILSKMIVPNTVMGSWE